MITNLNLGFEGEDVLTALPVDTSDVFCEASSDEYIRAIGLASRSVLNFLHNNKKVFSGVTPAFLRSRFEQIDLDNPLADYETLIAEVEELYTQHAIAFHLPAYAAHLNCPVVIPAIAAEVIISAVNSSLDTWDQSAGGTLMEQKLVEWTTDAIGFGAQADGVFTSGGSQSNLMGLLLARDHFAVARLGHDIKQKGLPPEASRFRIFVSQAGHFSIQKNAAILGLGEQSVISIRTDCSFRMNTVLLEDAIRREMTFGNIPIAIVATAGTTDFGNIDPLTEIGYLAAKYKLWFHVDAAYGCGLLLSGKHRHLLNGIELADSITTDYHKAFFQPVSSSAFLVRDKRYFGLITHYADYLNPKNEDDVPNQVNKSIQTTRRFDALKLWFTLRMMGREKLGTYIDKIIETASSVAEILDQDPDFDLLNHSDLSALVFRYHPFLVKEVNASQMNQFIKAKIQQQGSALIAGTKVNGMFYLKFTLLNPFTTIIHITDILLMIKKHGNDYITKH